MNEKDTPSVFVILNGDDFGYSQGVNRGILEAINNGILTSTSVMVHRKTAWEAKKYLRKRKDISVGIHLDYTEEGIRRWTGMLSMLTWTEQKMKTELQRQIDTFTKIIGRLPDHIDSHHHIHWLTRCRPIVLQFAKVNNIPVRSADARFELGFYGRSLRRWNDTHAVSPEKLIHVLQKLQPGIHEIMCHPGYVDLELKKTGTTYLSQREHEVLSLTSPLVKKFIQQQTRIKLITWKDVISLKRNQKNPS